jgi:hypothetical protein
LQAGAKASAGNGDAVKIVEISSAGFFLTLPPLLPFQTLLGMKRVSYGGSKAERLFKFSHSQILSRSLSHRIWCPSMLAPPFFSPASLDKTSLLLSFLCFLLGGVFAANDTQPISIFRSVHPFACHIKTT